MLQTCPDILLGRVEDQRCLLQPPKLCCICHKSILGINGSDDNGRNLDDAHDLVGNRKLRIIPALHAPQMIPFGAVSTSIHVEKLVSFASKPCRRQFSCEVRHNGENTDLKFSPVLNSLPFHRSCRCKHVHALEVQILIRDFAICDSGHGTNPVLIPAHLLHSDNHQ
jgi:hypothetical protein